MPGLKKDINEIKEGIKESRRKSKTSTQAFNASLSKEIKDSNASLLKEIKDSNASLLKEIKDVHIKFIPIYVSMAVYSTATLMANFKDFVAFLK